MIVRDCLTCKWEPDWTNMPTKSKPNQVGGECKRPLPSALKANIKCLVKRHKPTGRINFPRGNKRKCETWEPKWEFPEGEFNPIGMWINGQKEGVDIVDQYVSGQIVTVTDKHWVIESGEEDYRYYFAIRPERLYEFHLYATQEELELRLGAWPSR